MSRTTPIAVGLPMDGTGARSGLAAIVETTKPRITRMVVVTAVIGLVLAALQAGQRSWIELGVALLGVVVGTSLSASGANSLNQWWERHRDARMDRTRLRPIPAGIVSPRAVLLAGLVMSVLGAGVLWLVNGPVPAAVALVCTLSYVVLYTPMKVWTPWSTLVGAIPGALPPLIGWTAISGPANFATVLDPMGLSLVAIMTIWQLPHFLAIAWMYREDYAKGGYKVLPVLDPTGRATSIAMLITAAMLVVVSLLPAWTMPERVGVAYVAIALLSGLAYLGLCVRLARTRTVAFARRVFIASVMHLPLLLVALVADALI